MYFNKEFGLHFLTRALERTPGSAVLPWKTYRKPSEFRASHFSKPERFLIRTDLEGNIDYDIWQNLPRSDALSKVPATMRILQAKWRETHPIYAKDLKKFSTDPNSIKYLVHGVKKRENYLLQGSVMSNPRGQVSVWVGKHFGQQKWRDIPGYQFSLNESEKIIERLKTEGMLEKDAIPAANHLIAAAKALSLHVKKEKLTDRSHDWEASFAIEKENPTRIEFYDFLHRHPFG